MKKRPYTKPIIESSQIECDTFLSGSANPLQNINVYTNKTGNRVQLGKDNEFFFQEDEDFPENGFVLPDELEY